MRTEDVINRAMSGDIDAFEQIVVEYEKLVYNIAYRYVSNEADACDLTQESFLRVWRGISAFEGGSSFSTWVHRITVNVCIDFLRKEKRNKSISLVFLDDDESKSELELPDERFEPEAAFEQAEIKRQIESALSALEPEYRTVLVMREINGFSYSEIADLLGIKEGTVKSRISRARERLRRKLIAYGNFSSWLASNKSREES